MKFLVDAQLPRRLVDELRQAGPEAIHTRDLPLGNRTPDAVVSGLSIKEEYVLITKDSDFVDTFLLHRSPWKLLLVSTGNISNSDLQVIFVANLTNITEGFAVFDFIEINRANVIFHF